MLRAMLDALAAIGAVRSGRTRFVSGRSQADAARGPPLPNTALCNSPRAAVSADKALAVAQGPLGTLPGSPYPDGRKRGQGPCERGREDDIDQLHSFDIDWSNFPVSTLFGHSPCRLKIRTPAPPRLVHLAGTRCVFIAPIACGMNVPRSPHAPLGYTL